MKVGILTFTETVNFGASLQAYALQEIIQSYGIQVEIIRYKNRSIEAKEKNIGLKSFTPRGVLKTLIMGRGLRRKTKKFADFEAERLNFSPEISERELEQLNFRYDKVITGSDQVWNMKIIQGDYHYFLDFIHDSNKKISYAASFGNEHFPEESRMKAGRLLEAINAVSVREESGKKLISEISNKKAAVVVDPTLLMSKEDWKKRCRFIPKTRHYILVYFPNNKKKVFDFITMLKEQTGLPVIYLSISPRIQRGVTTIYDSSPEEFLGWVLYADYVVTGSFHGTAFSINMGKQFFYEPSGRGSRIDHLVRLCGMESRSIENYNSRNWNSLQDPIDYKEVWARLDIYRENSNKWLLEALKGAVNNEDDKDCPLGA